MIRLAAPPPPGCCWAAPNWPNTHMATLPFTPHTHPSTRPHLLMHAHLGPVLCVLAAAARHAAPPPPLAGPVAIQGATQAGHTGQPIALRHTPVTHARHPVTNDGTKVVVGAAATAATAAAIATPVAAPAAAPPTPATCAAQLAGAIPQHGVPWQRQREVAGGAAAVLMHQVPAAMRAAMGTTRTIPACAAALALLLACFTVPGLALALRLAALSVDVHEVVVALATPASARALARRCRLLPLQPLPAPPQQVVPVQRCGCSAVAAAQVVGSLLWRLLHPTLQLRPLAATLPALLLLLEVLMSGLRGIPLVCWRPLLDHHPLQLRSQRLASRRVRPRSSGSSGAIAAGCSSCRCQ